MSCQGCFSHSFSSLFPPYSRSLPHLCSLSFAVVVAENEMSRKSRQHDACVWSPFMGLRVSPLLCPSLSCDASLAGQALSRQNEEEEAGESGRSIFWSE